VLSGRSAVQSPDCAMPAVSFGVRMSPCLSPTQGSWQEADCVTGSTNITSGRYQVEVRELESLLTERDVARITKRSLSVVRKDRHSGRGVPMLRIGASVRYRPSDLSAFLDSCRVENRAPSDASAEDH
jgi:hypothetical protein